MYRETTVGKSLLRFKESARRSRTVVYGQARRLGDAMDNDITASVGTQLCGGDEQRKYLWIHASKAGLGCDPTSWIMKIHIPGKLWEGFCTRSNTKAHIALNDKSEGIHRVLWDVDEACDV
ncbi:uncharacterized protein B0H18DRAFT_950969 [Fomitopsis serialis]|uniref:uncharacterized protein n=1 Tax=Fomitopsis serialis TaxID=139415 RepID=UPI002008606E|nr:uncharacterized protein B0H18DRAFT_950969 [Neoantrodia serialis]KAH9935414.1 hypothetical protein B0H18DRAFT_950969 [Neoantrodia serialis]